jgi:2-iminobutanoate/2-iminopropanoate deaminase
MRAVETDAAPRPVGPYAQAIDAGDLVFCAGQVGLDPATGRLVAGGIAAETEQAIANLAAVLAAAGLGLDAVVKTTVYVTDLRDWPALNAAYARCFAAPYPARAAVEVAALPAGAHVEIEAIAMRRR